MEDLSQGVRKRKGKVEITTLQDADNAWQTDIEYNYYWSVMFDDMMPMIVLN